MKLDILAIGSHPDDIELSCAGTLAKEAAKGKTIGILDLTRGELGTRGTPEIRDQEAADAAKVLGVEVRENLEFADGFFTNDKQHQLKIVEIIRKYQPEIVICNAIDDRHPDHAKGSELTSVSCFLSGLRKIETKVDGKVQEAWRPKHVYHYIQWKDIKPDVVVDISGFIETKIDSVKAYKSQFFDPDNNEPATPISSNNFFESIRYRAANLGRLIGTDHAEGFTVERYPAVDSIFDLI
ncbi:bacillithiol biosynthesis deacetylase BshB1 [Nonlabens sp. Hel1_33_55]|uniref:bacillithiol biosynthesis deacetylase BshB1 n=1 Tax=Nonlabens sp. Hel1_33_55 TaxID=1336802 RepID=UPI000875CA06|nr:bacillithiol biosynthesis deacetylase BshB1 [Nonlabens sp. Hel1_33_55]SCY17676.1 bacillithiol biosynthesis deacetylase BshB1 [Nonlabens sp. Hel1_33_55]